MSKACRVCGSAVPFTAATYRGSGVLCGCHQAHFACPVCTGGLVVVLGEEDEREALLADVEPTFSAARDNREAEEESDAA